MPWLQSVTNDFDWAWSVAQFRKFGMVPDTVRHNNFEVVEVLYLLSQSLCPEDEVLKGWKPVRETTGPVVRSGMYYYMKSMGVETGTVDWSLGTTGESPRVSPTAPYAEFFRAWTGNTLQKRGASSTTTKAILEAKPQRSASTVAVATGLALDNKGAKGIIENLKRNEQLRDTLNAPVFEGQNYFDLSKGLSGLRVEQRDPQAFPSGGTADPLSGMIPPPTAAIAAGSVKVGLIADPMSVVAEETLQGASAPGASGPGASAAEASPDVEDPEAGVPAEEDPEAGAPAAEDPEMAGASAEEDPDDKKKRKGRERVKKQTKERVKKLRDGMDEQAREETRRRNTTRRAEARERKKPKTQT